MNTNKEIVIIYFSATGNTLMVVKRVEEIFKKHGLKITIVNSENINEIENLKLNNKILGVAFPVYGFSYPNEIIDKVLNVLPKTSEMIPAFLLSTYCIDNKIANKHLSLFLINHGFIPIYQGGFKCPSAGFACMMSG